MKEIPLEKELKLTNSGGLTVFFIGAGSAFSKVNQQTNVLVIKGESHVLIDCGTICSVALKNYGLGMHQVQNLLITHSHADHIGGLEEVALLGKFFTGSRPKMVITDKYKEILWNESLKGGCAYSKSKGGGNLVFDDYFEQVKPKRISKLEREFAQAQIGSISLKIFRTMHVPECATSWKDSMLSYGVVIDDRILFSADSRFDKNMIESILKDFPTIEVIFHDCQFFEGGVHAAYQELKTLDRKIKKMMYLCHYGDNYRDYTPSKDGFIDFVKKGVYYNLDE